MELDRGLKKKERKKSHTDVQISFDKGPEIIQWGKDFFPQRVLLGKQETHVTKNEAGPFTHTINKINALYIRKPRKRHEDLRRNIGYLAASSWL